MYREYDNILTITVNDWLEAGLTYKQFEHDSCKGLLRIHRRGINGNTTIDVRSIRRPERLAAIEAKFGKVDAVAGKASSITLDEDAAAYYRSYTYTDKTGKECHIPENTQRIYTNEASILGALKRSLDRMKIARAPKNKRVKMGEFYANGTALAKRLNEPQNGEAPQMPNKLPRNPFSFQRKFEKFISKDGGYFTLVHPSFGNSSSEKLTEEAKYWLIARWATPINKLTLKQLHEEYNAECALNAGWKPLKHENTIRQFLNRPEVEPLWYGMRYGELKAKEKYTRQHRTLLPTMRDSIWYGDGTKLNFYYRNDNGKMATTSVYEVMDVYSECLLGFHVSDSEDFEAQYYAYRMALQFSGYKPYEIRFDNQGGHKKLKSGEFFKKLAHLAINTAPYNGRSKTIESAFNRFQSQFLHKLWYFTGQNITSKKQESKANMEFILANQANLPTLEEAIKAYVRCREEWQSSPHYKTGMAHIKMYRTSENPRAQKVDTLELISTFGLVNSTPNTYRSNGIEMKVKGQTHVWEVLDGSGNPDFDFLKCNVDRKFHIGYDPNDMEVVALYTKTPQGDYRFETMAQKYIEIHRGKQDQDTLDHAFIKAMELKNKQLRLDMQDNIEQIMENNGMHPAQHGLNMPKVKGINLKKGDDIGTYTKKVSNVVPTDIYECVEDKY
jgi:Integrase core domain.